MVIKVVVIHFLVKKYATAAKTNTPIIRQTIDLIIDDL